MLYRGFSVFIRQLTYLPLIAGPVPTAVTVLGGLGFLYLVVGRSSVPCRGFPHGSAFSSSARPPGRLRRRDACRVGAGRTGQPVEPTPRA
jgi:hypothetical protein